MYRTEKLVIRLHEHERAAVDRLAQMERLPSSTLARQLLLKEAERRGILPPSWGITPGEEIIRPGERV